MALFSIIQVYRDAELRVSFKCNHHYSYTIKSTKNTNSECSRSRLEGDANDWPRPRPRPWILYEKICYQCLEKEWERRQRIICIPLHAQRINRIPHMNPPPIIFGRTNSTSSLPSSSSSPSLLTPLSVTGLGQRVQKQIEKFAMCQQEIFIYNEVHKLRRFLPQVLPGGACLDIIRAADRLRETNENIREWEIEHGISLSDLYCKGSADLLAQCGREVVAFILRTCVCVDFGFPPEQFQNPTWGKNGLSGSISLLENARSMIPEVALRLSVLEERIGFKTAHLQTVKDTKLLDRAQDFIAAIAPDSLPEAATNHPSIAEPDGSVNAHWPPPPATIWLTELQELQELLPQSMRYADDILPYALNYMTYLKLELDNHRKEILDPEELPWQFPSIASTSYLIKSHQITSIRDGDNSKERTSSIASDCSKDSDSASIWTFLRGDDSEGEDAEGPAVVQLPAKSEPPDCKGEAVIFPEHAIPGMEEGNRNEAVGNSPVVDSEAKDSEGEDAEGEDSASFWTFLRGDDSEDDSEGEDAEGPAVVQLPAKSEPPDCKGGAVNSPEHAIPGMEEENRNEAVGNSPVVDSEAKDSEGEDAEGEDSDRKDSEGEDSDGKDSDGKDSDGKDSDGKDSDGKDSDKRTSSIISDQDSEDSEDSEDSANSSVQSIETDLGDASHSDKYHHSSQSSVITKRDELCESNSVDAAEHTSAKELGKLDFTTDTCMMGLSEEEEDEELRERESEEQEMEWWEMEEEVEDGELEDDNVDFSDIEEDADDHQLIRVQSMLRAFNRWTVARWSTPTGRQYHVPLGLGISSALNRVIRRRMMGERSSTRDRRPHPGPHPLRNYVVPEDVGEAGSTEFEAQSSEEVDGSPEAQGTQNPNASQNLAQDGSGASQVPENRRHGQQSAARANASPFAAPTSVSQHDTGGGVIRPVDLDMERLLRSELRREMRDLEEREREERVLRETREYELRQAFEARRQGIFNRFQLSLRREMGYLDAGQNPTGDNPIANQEPSLGGDDAPAQERGYSGAVHNHTDTSGFIPPPSPRPQHLTYAPPSPPPTPVMARAILPAFQAPSTSQNSTTNRGPSLGVDDQETGDSGGTGHPAPDSESTGKPTKIAKNRRDSDVSVHK